MSKVLVVDDEQAIASLLAEVIQEQGHEVTIAFDGRQAYELAKGGAFSLVICDVWMPFVGGQELLTRLKEEPRTQATRIILMSAVSSSVQKVDATYGADGFLTKPFDLHDVKQMVDKLVVNPKNSPALS